MVSKKKTIRHNKIVEIVDEKGYVSIDYLMNTFGVSKVSIRRDLSQLDSEGRLIRKLCGAASLRDLQTAHLKSLNQETLNSSIDSAFENFSSDYKKQIAYAACSLIKDGSRIIMDAGSTVSAMIPYLDQKEKLFIMTNSLKIGYRLSELPLSNRLKLMITGGNYDQSSDTFQGVINKEVLKNYSFDQLFIGADGIDFSKGTVSINEGESYSEEMAESAQEVIVLLESSKLGRKMPKVELPWKKITTVITDKKVSSEHLEKLKAQGVCVIIAEDRI